MRESRHYWVVTVIQRFDSMELGAVGLIPVNIRTEGEPHAYLPVFESHEAALAWNNGDSANIYEMQFKAPAPEDAARGNR